MSDRKRLIGNIDHRFTDPAYLDSALSHPSTGSQASRNYERMEFLGDRVLGIVIAEWIFQRHENEQEGVLNRRFTGLVNRWTLADIAREIGIDRAVELAEGDNEKQLRQQPALLANTLEAVIAAIYLDGGLEPARAFIRRHFEKSLSEARKAPKDPKTALQEWAQGRSLGLPQYKVVERTGPSHAPFFRISVSVADAEPAVGSGKSKREAEMEAAREFLKSLEGEE
jgi:ribonuclease-3